MEIKITGNQSVYARVMNSARNAEKPVSVPANTDKKVRRDEIIISGGSMKKKEAAEAARRVYESMGGEAKAERLEQLKQQVQDGTYQIPAEVIAGKILSGM